MTGPGIDTATGINITSSNDTPLTDGRDRIADLPSRLRSVSRGGVDDAGRRQVRDESRITATRRRSDARLLQAPEHEAFDQRRSRKGVGERARVATGARQ